MAYSEYVLFVNVILQLFSTKIFPSARLSKRTFPFPLCSNNKYQLYIQTTCILQRNHIPVWQQYPTLRYSALQNTVLYHVHIYTSIHTGVGTFLEATMHDLIKSQKMLVTSPSH